MISSSGNHTKKIFEDARLSSDSVRVLLYVLTSGDEHPDKKEMFGFTYWSYVRILKELEVSGYLKRTRKRTGHRGWIHERFWYEESQVAQCWSDTNINTYITYNDCTSNDFDLDYEVNDLILQNFNSVDHGSPVEASPTTSLRSGGTDKNLENPVPRNTLLFEEVESGLEEFDEDLSSLALASGVDLEAVEFLLEKGLLCSNRRNYT